MTVATLPQVRKAVGQLDADLSLTFEHLAEIVDKLGPIPEISLAYCFSRIENGHRRLLYAGIVRKYRLDPELTWKFVLEHEISRKAFHDLYRAVFGHSLPSQIADKLKLAESIRDRMIHGKRPDTREMWGATLACFDYCRDVNVHLKQKAGFAGFGRMQGVTSRKGNPTLGKEVSRLALAGLGLSPKAQAAMSVP